MANVLKISEAASLGLHAMMIMTQKKDELVSVKDIAQILDISANHLSKVLQRLVKSELLQSIKGYGGGFKLAKKPADITFLEIYEAIDGRLKPTNCLLNRAEACSECMIMGNFLKSINKQVEEYFGKTTLYDFPLSSKK